MAEVYLGLGSNLGDRENNLRAAMHHLCGIGEITAVSPIYETEPWGLREQPPFLNAACAVRTDCAPLDLLHLVKSIEEVLGRRPTVRWGPRIIDIDILLYDDVVIATPELTIPHPSLPERAFVLIPLADIAPQVVHPILHRTIHRLARDVPGREGVRLFHYIT
jgi:2-amino-4-hydroxy-6-hydroxymethyldihydropteridine diphosphokinase